MARPDPKYDSTSTMDRNPFRDYDYEGYQQIADGTGEEMLSETEDIPPSIGINIIKSDSKSTRWSHIKDLDSFFSRMYSYHQKHGFHIMMLQEMFEVGQFLFVVCFLTYMLHCVNYPVLFREVNVNKTKVTLDDVTYSWEQCTDTFTFFTWMSLLLALLYWVFRIIRMFYHAIHFWEIKKFFNTALKIEDRELDNVTWHEIQKRIREVQTEQKMCIHKDNLTELDIYHRILRFKNYMVAMMNKNLIPAKVTLPLLGECVCLSRGLRFNLQMIFFHLPWSPFENNWNLREDYKRQHKRTELAAKLARQITWIAFINLAFLPLIFLWQLMFYFFSYGELFKREPGTLGTRCWSLYGQIYLRHFNELEHELNARLSRAYRPALKYMNSFSSPMLIVIAKNVAFVCGGVMATIIFLTIYDEDVMQVEHVLSIATILGAIVLVARSLIPDENLIWCPEQLIVSVLAHVHYLPTSWRGFAHTNRVCQQFGQFFQLRITYILIELFSPIMTPFILLFTLRPRAIEIVDFFRNFTVSVVGVGDVCSFAQMDVRKHGNQTWQEPINKEVEVPTDQYTQGENGKTELSLVHFTLTNPTWRMPDDAKQFVEGIRRTAASEMNFGRGFGLTAMGQSLMSMESLGADYASVVHPLMQAQAGGVGLNLSLLQRNAHSLYPGTGTSTSNVMNSAVSGFDYYRLLHHGGNGEESFRKNTLENITEDDDQLGGGDADHSIRTHQSLPPMAASLKGLSRHEGPLNGSSEGLISSLYGGMPNDIPQPEISAADMSLSTLYLHNLRLRHTHQRSVELEQSQRQIWQRSTMGASALSHATEPRPSTSATAEKLPLLGDKRI